jgi:hypothetical protein
MLLPVVRSYLQICRLSSWPRANRVLMRSSLVEDLGLQLRRQLLHGLAFAHVLADTRQRLLHLAAILGGQFGIVGGGQGGSTWRICSATEPCRSICTATFSGLAATAPDRPSSNAIIMMRYIANLPIHPGTKGQLYDRHAASTRDLGHGADR